MGIECAALQRIAEISTQIRILDILLFDYDMGQRGRVGFTALEEVEEKVGEEEREGRGGREKEKGEERRRIGEEDGMRGRGWEKGGRGEGSYAYRYLLSDSPPGRGKGEAAGKQSPALGH